MKQIKYIAALSLLLGVVGCSGFLDQKPYSQIVDKNFFENEDELVVGVMAVYGQMQGVMRYEWAVTELRSDNTRAYAVNSTATQSVELAASDQNNFMTSNTNVNGYWEACYNQIYRVNNIMEFLGVANTVAVKNRIEGEMRFLRAHTYFNLVRLWGPSFLMDKPIEAAQARYKQRSSVEQVYDFIIADLKRVVDDNLLPTRAAQPKSEIGRAVQEAAKVLLAKVYMTRYKPGTAEYTKANDLLKEVIVSMGNPSAATDLVPFADIFSIEKELSNEIIFSVRFKAGNLGLGSPFGNYFAPNLSGANVVNGDGRSWNYVTSDIILAFDQESGDLRKDVSLAESYLNQVTGQEVTEEGNAGGARYIKKYMYGITTKEDGESDWPLYRMGDVLLLYAETQNELNGGEALKYLNLVRERAGLAAITPVTSYDIRSAIRMERRKELAFENHRFFDLLRYGNAVNDINNYIVSEGFYSGSKAYPYTPIKEWNLVLPIPQKVMNINPELAQNVGY